MKAGRIGSLGLLAILVILVVFVGSVTTDVSLRYGYTHQTALIIGCTSLAVMFGIVLIPIGIAVDRSLKQLQNSIESAARNQQQSCYVGPRLLSPLMHAFTGAIDQFNQREESLRHQIRDLEIRNRLSESDRRQIEAVLHALRDGVVVTDSFNEVVMANEHAAQIFGFDLNEAIHTSIDTLIPNREFTQLIYDAQEAAHFADCHHVEVNLPNAAADGRVTPYDIALSCIENHKKEAGGVVTILHDLTRERELSELKSEFVSKTSHELRTPLSSIRAYIEMLVDGEARDDESRQEFYRIIQNEADRLGRLIENMLNISRIEAGIIQIERENVDIKQLIERAIDTLEPQAREKDISIHSRVAALDLTVEGDADMLYQVVLNLLSNAVKYTPEEGRVTIAADSENLTRSVVVSVTDTGLGVPPDAIPKLFDKFYRVENYKRIAKGTGLGLNLCKHIVETVHRGQMGVESELGMGSKFWFSVPVRYVGSKVAA